MPTCIKCQHKVTPESVGMKPNHALNVGEFSQKSGFQYYFHSEGHTLWACEPCSKDIFALAKPLLDIFGVMADGIRLDHMIKNH